MRNIAAKPWVLPFLFGLMLWKRQKHLFLAYPKKNWSSCEFSGILLYQLQWNIYLEPIIKTQDVSLGWLLCPIPESPHLEILVQKPYCSTFFICTPNKILVMFCSSQDYLASYSLRSVYWILPFPCMKLCLLGWVWRKSRGWNTAESTLRLFSEWSKIVWPFTAPICGSFASFIPILSSGKAYSPISQFLLPHYLLSSNILSF